MNGRDSSWKKSLWRSLTTPFFHAESDSPPYGRTNILKLRHPVMPSHNRQQLVRQEFSLSRVQCSVPGCRRWFRNLSGRTKHIRSSHGPHGAMLLSSNVHQRRLSSGSDRDRMRVSDVPPSPPRPRSPFAPSQDTQLPPASWQNSPPLNITSTAAHINERSRAGSRDPWLSSPGQWLHPTSSSPPGHPPQSHPPRLSPEPASDGRETPISKVYHPFINGKDTLPFVASTH
jgi:hypothetical protein